MTIIDEQISRLFNISVYVRFFLCCPTYTNMLMFIIIKFINKFITELWCDYGIIRIINVVVKHDCYTLGMSLNAMQMRNPSKYLVTGSPRCGTLE